MNIDMIRSYVYKNMGKIKTIRYNAGRGQIDEYKGVIIKIYKGIFLVKSLKDDRIKSYSYSDVLMRNLIIYDNLSKNT